MSELKAKHVVDVYDAYSSNPYNEAQVYLKAEADKVIAEKDAEIARLVRCLANANVCAEKLYRQNLTVYGYEFYCKWLKRWLAIAENFKPNSTAQ